MGKSDHAFIRLVRAKFEHACMVSDKVQNVSAFVEKYMYEYKTLGIRLHSWQRFEKMMFWLCILLGGAGCGLAYYVQGLSGELYYYGIGGGIGAAFLLMLRLTADEQYQLEAAKTYMVDFLENTYAHRYTKSNQKEIQVTVQQSVLEKEEGERPETVAASGMARSVPYSDPGIQEVPPVSDPLVYPGQMPVQEPVPTPAPAPQTPPEPTPEIKPMPPVAPVAKVKTGTVKQEVRREEDNTEIVDKQELQKEARIREILEEFLA